MPPEANTKNDVHEFTRGKIPYTAALRRVSRNGVMNIAMKNLRESVAMFDDTLTVRRDFALDSVCTLACGIGFEVIVSLFMLC